MAGSGIMKAVLWVSCLGLTLAQSQSSSSGSNSNYSPPSGSSLVSNSSSSASSSSLSTLSASALPVVSATVLSTSASNVANSTALSTPTPTPTAPAVYVNPWAGNFSGPAPHTGTGSDYALQCQNAYFSFTSINSDFITGTQSLYNFTSVIRSTTVYEVHTYYTTSFYTLCDGHPRVITSVPTATLTTTLPPSTTVLLAEGVDFSSLADPNCTVKWDDCRGLWSRYYSASSAYDAVSFQSAHTVVSLGPGASFWVVDGVTTTFPTPFPEKISLGTEDIHRYLDESKYIVVTTPPPGGLFLDDGYTMNAGGDPITIEHAIDFTNTPYTPHCRTEQPICTAGQQCQIDGDRVEIFYFPPQTNASVNYCATAPLGYGVTSRPPTNFTWTPITTGPYTVLPGNTTWFSGNVYVSLNRINAKCTWSGTPVEVGDQHGGQVLTMAPSELFSQRAHPLSSGMWEFSSYAYSFNFADLQSPYPWSAWNGAPECVVDRCSTINGNYNPWIAVPEAIRRLDPKWSTCDLALYGLYDPPRALTSVGNIFATLTSKEAQPSATPGQSPPQSVIKPTSAPQPDPPVQSQPADPPTQSRPADPPANSPPVNNPPSQPADPPANSPPVNNPPSQPEDPPANSPPANNPPSNTAPTNDPPVNNPPAQSNPADPAQPGVTPAPTPIQPAAPTTIGSIGGQPVVVNPAHPSNVVVGGTQTLVPGASGIVVSGIPVSMIDPSHIVVSTPGAIAPSTINIPRPAAAAPTTFATVGGQPVVANPTASSQVVIGGQTLTQGSAGITISGTSVSMIDASHIVISTPGATSIQTLNVPQPNSASPTSGVVVTLPNGDTITATAVSGPSGISVMVSGTIFSEGGPPVTLPNGVILSEAPSGTGVVVINPSSGISSTIPFSSVPGLAPNLASATPHPTPGAIVTIGGQTYTVINQNSSVIIPGLAITLTEGGSAVTVNGTVLSDAGTGVVVGSTTQAFSTITVSEEPTGSESQPGVAGTAQATGAAARVGAWKGWWWRCCCVAGIMFLGTVLV